MDHLSQINQHLDNLLKGTLCFIHIAKTMETKRKRKNS